MVSRSPALSPVLLLALALARTAVAPGQRAARPSPPPTKDAVRQVRKTSKPPTLIPLPMALPAIPPPAPPLISRTLSAADAAKLAAAAATNLGTVGGAAQSSGEAAAYKVKAPMDRSAGLSGLGAGATGAAPRAANPRDSRKKPRKNVQAPQSAAVPSRLHDIGLLVLVVVSQLALFAWIAASFANLKLMGAFYGSMLVLRRLASVLACYTCAYSFIVGGPGAALLPSVAMQTCMLAWHGAAGSASRVAGLDRATILQHIFPVLAVCLCLVFWWEWECTPHELLPNSFYRSNEFKLFGRNFTVHKAIDDDPDLEEAGVLQAAEQLLIAAAIGVAFGVVSGVGLAPLLHAGGLIQSVWPPDPIPGYEYEPNEALQPVGSPRRSVTSMKDPFTIAAARSAFVFCEALAEELMFRSVGYRACAELLHGMRDDEAHASLEFGPTLVIAVLFSAKFLGYKGEVLAGMALGVLLQCLLFYWGSVTPGIVTHGFVLLTRDFFRAARPLPKPSRRRLGVRCQLQANISLGGTTLV